MYCRNTTFIYHNDFSKYMKVEGAISKDVFDAEAKKFLSKKGKKYLHESFEKWDQEHLQPDEDFDDFQNNDKLKNIIGDEDMHDLNMDD